MDDSGKDRKYRVIANALRDDIFAGKYASGAAFPSVKMICRRFGVSHLTAVKAMETLKGMGLVRSRSGAGTFVVRRMTSVGLIVPRVEQAEIFEPICREFSRLCVERGVAIDFVDISSVRPGRLRSVLSDTARRMASVGMAGVVYRSVDFTEDASLVNREVLHIFREAGIPVVILDSDVVPEPGGDRFDFVGVDNFEIGTHLAMHVLEQGAKRIALASMVDMSGNVRRRYDGVSSVVSRSRGAKITGTYVLPDDEESMAAVWKKSLPDAVVCTSDYVAARVLKLLAKAGRRCPQDVLVTGVNDVSIASLLTPALTTVHQPCESIAHTAFETLFWRIENPHADPRRVMIAADLVVRESTVR